MSVAAVTTPRFVAQVGRRDTISTIMIIAVTLLATACRATEPPVVPLVAAQLLVQPSPLSLEIGATQRLAAIVTDAAGATLPDPALLWRSDEPAIAAVSADGVVTGRGMGVTVVHATSGSVTGATLVSVTPTPVASIKIAPHSDTLIVGTSDVFVIQTFDPRGAPLNYIGPGLTWTSSDPAIVAFSAQTRGLLQAMALGTATITASLNGLTASATIVVVAPPPPISLRLTPNNILLVVGGTQPLTLQLVNRAGQVVDSLFPITWSSSAPAVATISSAGLVTAVGPGTTTLTAASGSASVTATVLVRPPPAPGLVTSLVSGLNHACALTSAGVASCWGLALELGIGRLDGLSLVPQPVATSLTFASLAPGMAQHACGLTAEGAAYCWGRNDQGQLGDGSVRDQPTPVRVLFNSPLTAIAVGGSHTCALTTAGAAYCWGTNLYGESGYGRSDIGGTRIITPVAVQGGLTFRAIAVGDLHTCGLTLTTGEAYCWGYVESRYSATPVRRETGAVRFVSLSAGGGHSCAVSDSGAGLCWGGNNRAGGLANYGLIPNLTFRTISTGAFTTCGVTTSDVAYCWGSNEHGDLGNGTADLSAHPVPMPVYGTMRFADIAVGFTSVCARTRDGTVWCWGGNAHGEVGDGTMTTRYIPVPVQSPQ